MNIKNIQNKIVKTTSAQREYMIKKFFIYFLFIFLTPPLWFFHNTASQAKQKKKKLILVVKNTEDETCREIDLSQGDLILLRNSYYLEVCAIEKTHHCIGFRKRSQSEIYVRIFDKTKNSQQRDIWEGRIGVWPQSRPFEQPAVLKKLGMILLIKEIVHQKK
jgi:hypothetical protein